MKDRPEVDFCDKSFCPSLRITTTTATEEKQDPMLKGDETDLIKNNNECLIVSNNANLEENNN